MRDTIYKNICPVLLLVFALVLPTTSPNSAFNAAPWMVAVLFSWWLVGLGINICKKNVNKIACPRLMAVLLFALLYAAYIYGMLISQGIKVNDWFQKLPFVLLPCALLIPMVDYMDEKKWICFKLTYAIACVLSLLMCILHAYIGELSHFHFYNYYYSTLTGWLRHPAYLSMMYTMAIIFMVDLLYNKELSIKVKVMIHIINVFLSIGVVLSGSRAGILAFIVILFLYFVYVSCFERYHIKQWILSAMIPIMCFCISFLLLPRQQNRVIVTQSVVTDELSQRYHKSSPKDARVQAWQAAWSIGKQYFPKGVGIADFQQEQQNFYRQHQYWVSAKKDLNAHNQYLQALASMGLLGIFSLLCLLAFILYTGVKNRNAVLCLFGVLIMINFMFESMLERQDGIMFAVFFTCVLMMDISDKKFDNENSKHSRGEASVR